MPPSMKRKRDELDDSDDEEPSFGRQILPVANLSADFNGKPVDGMQYLFTVRRDARHLPHVTRVVNPFEVAEPSHPPPLNSPTYSSHPGLPSKEWRASFDRHFRNFRKNVIQPTIHVDIPSQEHSRRLMPDKKERDFWWAFISGRPESDWNPPKKRKHKKKHKFAHGMLAFPEDHNSDTEESMISQETWHINDEGEVELALAIDPTESLPTPSGTPAPQDSPADTAHSALSLIDSPHKPFAYRAREPKPSLMQHIDHRMSLHLLMYFTHWIKQHLQQPDPPSSHLTETHSRWIFSLLSRVEDHISADDMSLLRNLARACLALAIKQIKKTSVSDAEKSDLTQDAEIKPMSERACWMIIAAVVEFWGQRDLWMDAEAALVVTDPAS